MSDHIPPWQDRPELMRNICCSDTTVDNWVAQKLIPPPRIRDGIPMWKWSEVEKALRGIIYFIEGGDLIKIGFTEALAKRLAGLQSASPVPIKLLFFVGGSRRHEKFLHRQFARDRVRGEWFRKSEALLAYLAEIQRQ